MREFTFYRQPFYSKLLQWSKLITVTGGVQAIVQLTGMVVGILIIRSLPTKEYAYYTLANTTLGVMTILSDSGISNGVMAEGGKVWQSRIDLGTVIASGLKLRRKFAISVLLISLPWLVYLLIINGADWSTSLLIVAAIIPTFIAALSDTLLEVGPKLHQQINLLQKNQFEVSIFRLFFTGISIFLFPFTATALIINGSARLLGNWKLKKSTHTYMDNKAESSNVVQKDLMKVVRRTLPPTLYYCFSGQIIIWIPSILGNTNGIAQVGALSRLTMFLNFFSIMISTLVLPRFARIQQDNYKNLSKIFLLVQGLLIISSLFIILLFYTFPNELLWVLGDSYKDLSTELLLIISSNCIGLLSNMTSRIIGSRGWVINPVTIIVVNVFSIVVAYYYFNLSSIIGLLYYDILLNSVTYFFAIVYGFICIKRPIK